MSKRGTLIKSGYLSAVGLSSVKMVADRRRHAAKRNKHWRPASQDCQHWWPGLTLNLKIGVFLVIFGRKWVNCNEMDGDRPRLPVNRNCYRLSHVSWALAQISCYVWSFTSTVNRLYATASRNLLNFRVILKGLGNVFFLYSWYHGYQWTVLEQGLTMLFSYIRFVSNIRQSQLVTTNVRVICLVLYLFHCRLCL